MPNKVEVLEQPYDNEWIECNKCGDHWCTIHDAHAYECPCIPLWIAEAEDMKLIKEDGKIYVEVGV